MRVRTTTKTGRTLMLLGGAIVAAGLTLWAADPLAQLGVSQKEASEQLMSAITAGGTPYGTPVVAFRKLSATARGALVQDLGAWAKAYAASPAFRTAYTAYRTTQKPAAPSSTGSVDDEIKRKQADQAAQLAETRKNLGLLPADQRKVIEESMKQAEQMMNSPEMLKAMRDGIVADRASEQQGYQESVTTWQTNYPENPNALIAKQLRRFLEASADVDFNARLAVSGGRATFVNPAYEDKSGEWKMCFRAGREAVTAGRTIAAAWLKEIGG